MVVIKAVYTATSTAPVASGGVITTSVIPKVTRYLATITTGMIGATDTTIPAASFTDDIGGPVVTLPALTGQDYFNVYLNGILQQGGLSNLSTTHLVLEAIEPDVKDDVPVLLEVSNFANVTSDMTTPPTISAPVITIIT